MNDILNLHANPNGSLKMYMLPLSDFARLNLVCQSNGWEAANFGMICDKGSIGEIIITLCLHFYDSFRGEAQITLHDCSELYFREFL